MPKPLDSRFNLLPPVPALQFKESKINPLSEFYGKTTKYIIFLNYYKFYFDNKPSMFLDNGKTKFPSAYLIYIDASVPGHMQFAVLTLTNLFSPLDLSLNLEWTPCLKISTI